MMPVEYASLALGGLALLGVVWVSYRGSVVSARLLRDVENTRECLRGEWRPWQEKLTVLTNRPADSLVSQRAHGALRRRVLALERIAKRLEPIEKSLADDRLRWDRIASDADTAGSWMKGEADRQTAAYSKMRARAIVRVKEEYLTYQHDMDNLRGRVAALERAVKAIEGNSGPAAQKPKQDAPDE